MERRDFQKESSFEAKQGQGPRERGGIFRRKGSKKWREKEAK